MKWLLCLVLVLGAATSWARPGGGSSFRSSSSSRSGGSFSGSRSSGSYSGSHSYSGSGGDVSLDPATVALLGHVVFGAVLSFPAVVAWALLLAGFRRDARGQRGRPGLFRMLFGLVLLGVFGLLALGQLAGDPDETLVGMFLCAGLGLFYQINQLQSSGTVVIDSSPAPTPNLATTQALAQLHERDAGFSRVVFLDFVQALYHQLHARLGRPNLRELGAFVADEVLQPFVDEAGPGAQDTAVVLGAMSISRVELSEAFDAITLELEGNFTRQRADAEPVRLVVRERWRLRRPAGLESPQPDRMRVLSCPACGAALSVSELGACTYCNAPLRSGKLQWRLQRRAVLSTEAFSTEGLGETVPEEGTDLPTIYDADLAAYSESLAGREGVEPGAWLAKFRDQVVDVTFTKMYAAWSSRRWNEVRHLLTDFSWEAQQSWVRAYLEKGLTNRLDDLSLANVELVRVEADRYYDAVTVRLYAACRDYTVDKNGKTIGGDPRKLRRFSEYWTFIRATGAKAGAAAQEGKCPNCGAPIDRIGSTGICGYCDAKVTTGDFGWVLATITQDEVYFGV